MRELPDPFQKFGRERPEVHRAYEALAKAAHESGPLDERTRRLVKLAVSVGARLEGAVRSHTWQAKEAGISEAEIDPSATWRACRSVVTWRRWRRPRPAPRQVWSPPV